MRAILIEEFGAPPVLTDVAAPDCAPDGVVLQVEATGLCRSDWHAWQGHDPDVHLPHVPGHEIAGTVAEVGAGVTSWQVGDRVTVPFVCGCGHCEQCQSGNAQTCPQQEQPGFTYWGSYAEKVAIPAADFNLVRLPDDLSFAAAAALGCRFATAFRAVHQVGRLRAGESLAVIGCGGVGLSAIQLAVALNARVTAYDRSSAALEQAARHGAAATVLLDGTDRPVIADSDVTMDAIGAPDAVELALQLLLPRGRHLQVGLLPGASTLAIGPLIAKELQWLGCHGMSAADYVPMIAEISAGRLRPADLIAREIGLADVPAALAALDGNPASGITVIRPQLR